jgi:CRISPR-associated protein Cmr2
MTWPKPDITYWNNKFAAWWHDPIDKVFNIQKHEDWAADYINVFGLQRPNDEFWIKADAIAAGFERGQVPSYSTDHNKNGAVDFTDEPLITHPTTEKNNILKIGGKVMNSANIHDAAVEFLKKHIGTEKGKGDYADHFENNDERFAVARFLYTHFVLRFILAQNNIGGLGALWHRLPADSRFPDHSIWQHNALCSAMYSCIELGGKPEDVGLMVFSITPVQGFISRARKMRDFWVGSVLLSWLAFEGLRWVMENLGADHVLYPSLIDQPLVNAYLEKEWAVSGSFKPQIWEEQPNDIASLPNKFLFLIPFGKAEEIALEIKKEIAGSWDKLAQMTCAYLAKKKDLQGEEQSHLSAMLNRQTSNFWDYQWAAARLADNADKDELINLLDEGAFKNQFSYLQAINTILKKKGYSENNSSRGILYSTSHSLVQSALAAQKSRKLVIRNEEPGEKCQMCGEFEVLHARPWLGEKADDYKRSLSTFWAVMKDEQEHDIDFKENERLCAICMIKRLLPRILKEKDKGSHILAGVFSKAETFQSTTEMALHSYFQRRDPKPDAQKRKAIAQTLHQDEEQVKGEKLKNSDKYYALLMMDGDNMGKLINGEAIASTWNSIMHPAITDRLVNDDFDSLYKDVWQKIYKDNKLNRRLVTPAIHAAISEALGDFSIYGVAPIIDKHKGRLIYAGGDDVCAFLPANNALTAAREIKDYYTSTFRFIDVKRKSEAIRNEWMPNAGKLSINLGSGPDISISAAILICHHKESLTQMIERAQQLLKKEAKDKAGRNACVIELRKRHGGSRSFVRKWGDMDTDKKNWNSWDAFENIAKITAEKNRQLSHSLLYRIETLRPGIEAIIKHDPNAEVNLTRFIAKQIERSGIKSENSKIAQWITHIIWNRENTQEPFNPEGLLIAGFLSGEVDND